MRDQQIIVGFEHHDQAINKLRAKVDALGQATDKIYLSDLTHRMMWDVLIGLLESKGMMTKLQFDEAMKELSEKTKAAMEAEAKAKEDAKTKVTVTSQTPAIPVLK